MYHLKRNPIIIIIIIIIIMYYGTKMKSRAGSPRVKDSPNLPRGTGVKVTLVARPLLTPVAQNLCR
jgi:hypothetical protein